MSLFDVIELIELTQDTLDDLWKQSVPPYPENRMRHLLEVIGMVLFGCFVLFLNIYTVTAAIRANHFVCVGHNTIFTHLRTIYHTRLAYFY